MAARWTHGMTVPLRTFARAAGASQRLWRAAVSPARYGRALTWGLAVALVLLLASSGYLAVRTYQRGQEEQRRQDIVAAARQTAVNFTSLDYRRYDRDSENVLKGATGDFKRQFKGQTKALTKLVAANKSVSQGRVIEAGIARADARSARVLVVADSKVTNTAVKKGQVRNYRLQLDLVLENGRWMVSDVEFVG
jgi:Mce-associated membrane protein